MGVPMGTQSPNPTTSVDQPDTPVIVDDPVTSPASRGVPSTRASRAWTRVLPALIVLGILLVFVLQNLRRAKVSFAGFSGTLPLAVLLLAAAGLGALFVLALGSVRIVQLRRVIRRDRGR